MTKTRDVFISKRSFPQDLPHCNDDDFIQTFLIDSCLANLSTGPTIRDAYLWSRDFIYDTRLNLSADFTKEEMKNERAFLSNLIVELNIHSLIVVMNNLSWVNRRGVCQKLFGLYSQSADLGKFSRVAVDDAGGIRSGSYVSEVTTTRSPDEVFLSNIFQHRDTKKQSIAINLIDTNILDRRLLA